MRFEEMNDEEKMGYILIQYSEPRLPGKKSARARNDDYGENLLYSLVIYGVTDKFGNIIKSEPTLNDAINYFRPYYKDKRIKRVVRRAADKLESKGMISIGKLENGHEVYSINPDQFEDKVVKKSAVYGVMIELFGQSKGEELADAIIEAKDVYEKQI